jgi:hypothetical protein
MTGRAVHGLDLIVYLEGHDKTPEVVKTKEKCTEADLRSNYGGDDAIVFLKNKNLQRLPTDCRGAILWLSVMNVICVVIRANGKQACVEILSPISRKGETCTIKTVRLEGAYLEQVIGPPIMKLNKRFRRKKLRKNGHIDTPVDKNGFIRMSFRGPDIGMPDSLDVPEEAASVLAEDPFGKEHTSKLPPNPDKGQPVPTVYIYSPHGGEQYKFVEKYLDDADITAALKGRLNSSLYNDDLPNILDRRPVYCVPLGGPISTNSNRYVDTFGLCMTCLWSHQPSV